MLPKKWLWGRECVGDGRGTFCKTNPFLIVKLYHDFFSTIEGTITTSGTVYELVVGCTSKRSGHTTNQYSAMSILSRDCFRTVMILKLNTSLSTALTASRSQMYE
jgi:hypothetical protein